MKKRLQEATIRGTKVDWSVLGQPTCRRAWKTLHAMGAFGGNLLLHYSN